MCALAKTCRGRRGKSRRGCATSRRAPLLRRRLGRLRLIPGEAPRSPHSRGRSGRPHLANRTVPCSSGLRLTSRQLCRISSGSGSSMLAPGMRGAGLGPSGRGHRHRTCRAISAATRPVGASASRRLLWSPRLGRGAGGAGQGGVCGVGRGWSSHRSFPAQVEAPPPARRFQVPPLPAAMPCAPPRAARLGLFKAAAAPAPLHPDRRASPGDRLWPRTWRLGKGQGFRASRESPSLWGARFLIR